MLAAGFDTHETVKRLTGAGASEPLAEAIVSAIGDAGGRAATKSDLDALGAATKAELDAHRAATRSDLDALEAATRADLDAHRAATKSDLDALEAATKAELDAYRAATKSDLDALGAATRAGLDAHRAATRSDIEGLKVEIVAMETRLSAKFDARLFRALWLQGAGIVAVVAALNLLQ